VFFPLDIAVPCGMIINELVSNAIKYAFTDNREGKINVKIAEKENKGWELIIHDNGVGFSKNFDKDKTETLGLKLVDSLVEQINGSIEFKNNKGVKAIIIFKEK
jgi:two-component sensor histidine kinase